ncbi:MAG: tRNA (adenosine(37)-N6)-threonylcarbamoyltransferase complex dimerization subunit type 1 TsaB [Clostridia bacterium]|nr:tRNA (adenosine(37)-N6)-threonylcarbamoyltransferase complex dimerization subunit type 1 TsaB [Clostridia bacterium]
MIIIGVESSAVAASAAVLKDGVIVSECYLNAGLTHSQTLMTLIDGALRNADIAVKDADAFAVAHGPGSFTGVRIGVSAVKGLCFPYDTPCFGVSTLEAMAYCADAEDCVICPVMDARCQQVYTALFRKKNGEIRRLTEDEPLRLEELAERLNAYEAPVMLIGDGTAVAFTFLSQKSDRIRRFSEIYRFQRASGVAMAAWNMYNKGITPCGGAELQPVYLRPSQAERELKKKNAEKEEKERTT